ncbi:MAG: MGH1-like glycoside hydrolase domain-containing protein, partial [Woeseiaceae bacterium]
MPRILNTPAAAERSRLAEDSRGEARWKLWGPYLSERQWGTVREDYSPHGTAWDYFPHDNARSRAYRWGEDGIAGLSDEQQFLCFALALWNGNDPILKERLFGLTNDQGNHGEDAKELYYYLDATPTHSYLKYLYKYPQAAFPYERLIEENRRRGRDQSEFELIDTGHFNDDRYFDVFIEYAKAGPEDILVRITTYNRGPAAATLQLLPQLWFRNTWSWSADAVRPEMHVAPDGSIAALHAEFGEYRLYADGGPDLLFTDNDSNRARLFNVSGEHGHWKDAFHEYVVQGRTDAVNPDCRGTKAAAHYPLRIAAGAAAQIRLRLRRGATATPFEEFERTFG